MPNPTRPRRIRSQIKVGDRADSEPK